MSQVAVVAQSNQLDQKATRQLVDYDNLTEEEKKALEADHFIVYGVASIEQYDDDYPRQKLSMDALRQELQDFLKYGIISRGHNDVPVGKPLKSYSVGKPCTFKAGDRKIKIDEGDELRTHVDDDGRMWVVADIYNNSELANDTRLQSLRGDMDGFSVTVFVKEWDDTDEGQEVHDLDLHAVTVAEDHQIKNKGSDYGHVEFKAITEKLGGIIGKTGKTPKEKSRFMKGLAEKLRQKAIGIEEKAEDMDDIEHVIEMVEEELGEDAADIIRQYVSEAAEEATNAVMEEAGAEPGEPEQDDELVEEVEGKAEDGEEIVEKKSKESTMSDDEPDQKAGDLLAQLNNLPGPDFVELYQSIMGEEPGDMAERGEAAKDLINQITDAKADQLSEELPVAETSEAEEEAEEEIGEEATEEMVEEATEEMVEETIEEKSGTDDAKIIEEKADGIISEKMKGIEEKMESKLEEQAERIAQKAAESASEVMEEKVDEVTQKAVTGDTPTPSGGSTQDQTDYQEEISKRFGSKK